VGAHWLKKALICLILEATRAFFWAWEVFLLRSHFWPFEFLKTRVGA